MSLVELHEKGARAWISTGPPGNDWTISTIIERRERGDLFELTLEDEHGKSHKLEFKLSELAQTNTLPPLANPEVMDCIDDLTDLTYLHEPGVMHTVKMRYAQQIIYTYSGIVLIAVNPFARVPLYSPEIAQAYSGKRKGELDPHVFAVAEDAFRELDIAHRNQSIIVSGESGAGKTISAKYIMRYFAAFGGSSGTSASFAIDQGGHGGGSDGWDSRPSSSVEEQVLATNPIMEAFGNAKTTRNDNSSRFGKYIEIQFNSNSSIIGATIRTYLLERSRVVFQPDTERNYHIFYQLCAGVPTAEKKELDMSSLENFHYLNQGGRGVIQGVDDALEFNGTVKALSTVGISVSMQWKIFRLLAAILHMGNIPITDPKDNGKAFVDPQDKSVKNVCRLIGIDGDIFCKWITNKEIIARNESILTVLNIAQSTIARDAVAKYMYHTIFDWLVVQINRSLSAPIDSGIKRFIGVLDIYGFEHFKRNSFEQFCINYANEKLQQEFIHHVFKLEQEEYIKEKMQWAFIDFNDNQPCIELIEGKLGILDLLDDESRAPTGTDASFVDKLYRYYATPPKKHDSFAKPRFSNMAFTVNHYAHSVDYSVEGFLEKNKDTLPDEILKLLQKSQIDFISELFQAKALDVKVADDPSTGTAKSARKKIPTLGSGFKNSLEQLMETINSTNAHYIRCIKPNEQKLPFTFDSRYVLSQLRACGVLETIRISCAGYPSRFLNADFADRYLILLPTADREAIRASNIESQDACMKILKHVIKNEDRYQVGITKIFLRAGQLAFLEKIRSDKLNNAASTIQKIVKGRMQRRKFLKMRTLALQLQGAIRMYMARRKVRHIRERRAAKKIQRVFRGYLVRRVTNARKRQIIRLQSQVRYFLARTSLVRARRDAVALKIQKVYRGHLVRRETKARNRQIVKVQSCVRRHYAIKEYKKLKQESRSIQYVQKKAGALESKVFELTQLLANKEKDASNAKHQVGVLEAQIVSMKEKHEKSLKQKQDAENKLSAEVEKLRAFNQRLFGENVEYAKLNQQMEADLKTRNGELGNLKEKISTLKTTVEAAREQVVESGRKGDDIRLQQVLAENLVLKEKLSRFVIGRGKLERGTTGITITSLPGYENAISPSMPSAAISSELPLHEIPQPTQLDTPKRVFRRHSSLDTGRAMIETSSRRGSADSHNSQPEAPAPPEVVVNIKPIAPVDELQKLFYDPIVDKELGDLLITHLPVPPSLPPEVRPKWECVFPAHLTGLAVINCWRCGYTERMKVILSSAIKNIHMIMKYTDDNVCAFWLSNLFELVCIMATAERGSQAQPDDVKNTKKHIEIEKVISKFKADAEYLMMDIYYNWLKEMKRKLNALSGPCVIEHQGLPGFIESANQVPVGFITKWMGSSPAAENKSVPIEKLLSWLTRINGIMQSYYLADSIRRQLLTSLMKLLGTTSFNYLLMKKNFCTWRRGMQIQYNVTRLEEWCMQHDIGEATLHLEPLMQATKLLQLNKSTAEDLDIINDVCFLLSPMQIKKILTVYHAGEYDEHPVSALIIQAANSRCTAGSDNTLLLETNDDSPFLVPAAANIQRMEKFIPAYLSSKLIALQHIIEI